MGLSIFLKTHRLAPVSAASENERGFTLIEVIVALAIAGVLMLSAAGLYWQQKEIGQRLVAERAADTALENTYEMLRSGEITLVSAVLDDPTGSGVALTVSVTDGPVPATKALDLVATYRVHDQPFRRALHAIVHVTAPP
jgi:prepilin-type N-terminal cleavage/methylation domain-containing protein